MGNVYGYVRVSSKDQNEDRQMITMKEMEVPDGHIYVDKQSGKDFNRPQYKKLMRRVKPNDHIYIKSIDRLGRNYSDAELVIHELIFSSFRDIVYMLFNAV